MSFETTGLIEATAFIGKKLPEFNQRAMRLAVSTVSRNGRAQVAREIRRQVAFPANYLTPSAKPPRLQLLDRPRSNGLAKIIRARGRPTSLHRFLRGGAPRRGEPARIQVKPGRLRAIHRAFAIRLRGGSDGSNFGLAIRLRAGETLRNKKVSVQKGGKLKGLTLLYGPSVQQVFFDNEGDGVARTIAPDLARQLEREYLRQFAMLR